MQVTVRSGAPGDTGISALVVPVFADGKLDGAAKAADVALGGAIADVFATKEMAGGANEVALIHANAGGLRRVLVVGLGKREKFDLSKLAHYAGTAVRYLGKRNVTSIAYALPAQAKGHERDAAAFVVEGALTGTIDQTTYRTEPDKPVVTNEIAVLDTAGSEQFDGEALKDGAERGRILGEAANYARTLALTPANDMTPTHMAEAAKRVASEHGLAFHVLDEDAMLDKKMGSILSVSRGSDEPAKMIVLEYAGDPGSKTKLALVGKGITFDSGGISIKPAENMHEMKYDMSGGAGVIAAMGAIARLKPKLNVLGIVAASENLPGPRATKPGDVVRAMNGKTIEVINTDAEGRLVLADALCYARELGATEIVDAATLTGAMVVSLGHSAAGAISNDEAFLGRFLASAKETSERYWPLPLYDEFHSTVKSEIADLRNSTGRPAGSLTAAAFLAAFVDNVPWIHLDIAGTAYTDAETPYAAKGPTGAPVRAFVAFVEREAGSAHAHGKNGSGKAVTNGANGAKKAGASA